MREPSVMTQLRTDSMKNQTAARTRYILFCCMYFKKPGAGAVSSDATCTDSMKNQSAARTRL